jgi:hypothetical protein
MVKALFDTNVLTDYLSGIGAAKKELSGIRIPRSIFLCASQRKLRDAGSRRCVAERPRLCQNIIL